MRLLVKMAIACPKHERPDPAKCEGCKAVERFRREKDAIERQREQMLARIREALKVKKIIVISEIG
jgi:hypothetical protein